MSFIEQWQSQIEDSLIKCAKLVLSPANAELKYQLMVVGVLWPVRQSILDFNFEAIEAVHDVSGGNGKLVLQMVQQWSGDRLAVARSLSAHTLQSGELGAVLNKLIAHFHAFPTFAQQLSKQAQAIKQASKAEVPTEPSLELPSVLVSYVGSDGKPLATEVTERLREERISVWADLTYLEGTHNWWQQTTKALDRVKFLVLVMTPAAMQSEMVRKQWRYARQKGVCIYPVLKSQTLDFSLLPRWIREIHFYNLHLEWSKLIKDLKGICQTPRIPFMVEDLLSDYVTRPRELEQMKAQFFDAERQEAIPSTVALHGAGGYGKTILARALCHDDDIRQVFNNGVLWVTLGENPGDLSRYVIDLIEVLSGERPGFTGVDAAVVRLGELLADRDLLLVIDDVWNSAHIKPFLQGGARCARLITTRDISVFPPAVKNITVSGMQQDEAVTLLGSELPYGYPGRMRQLADNLGQWPLLLKLANGTLRDRVYKYHERLPEALTYVEQELTKHGLSAFDSDNPVARNQAVTQTIDISLGLLDESERMRYNELAIFPEDINIPLVTLEKLWGVTGGLDDFDTEELCDHLHELSLLAHLDLTSRYIRLHRAIRSYLVHGQDDDLTALHNQFLNAYGFSSSSPLQGEESDASSKNTEEGNIWADMSPDEPYLWTYLAYHLIEADRPAELVNLVKNLCYLAAKIYVKGVHYAEVDLLTAEEVTSNDIFLRVLRRVLAQTNHLLALCKTLNEVGNTLHSRLIHLPELAPVAIDAEPNLPKPLLTARHILPDQPDPTLVRTLQGHTSGVMDCAVSADGSIAVSIAKNRTLIIWNTETGTAHLTLADHNANIWGCGIDAAGEVLVASFDDGTLGLWDVHAGTQLNAWAGHESGVMSCAITADAAVVVSASKDKTLKVWDAQSGAQRLTLTGHQRTVTGCDINADGTIIVSASNDGTLNIWDAQSGELQTTLMIRLVTAGFDRLTFLSQRDINFDCAISANGALVAATSSTGTVTVWDVETETERFSLTADKRGVSGCAFTANGEMLVCALSNRTLKAWDTQNGAECLTMIDHTRAVNACAVSANGAVIVSASDDKTLKVWDGQQSKATDMTAISHTGTAYSCAISADGSLAVTAMANKTLKVWNVAKATERLILKGHTRKINDCTLSQDGNTIVSASQDQTLKIWDAQTGTQRLTLTGHTWAVLSCAVSQDGNTVISASDDKTLKVWDAQTGTERFTLADHTRTVTSCVLSADEQLIVSASGDGTLKIWDAQIGTKRLTLRGHTAWVNDCAISDDGQVILSASYDKTLKVWAVDNATELLTLPGHAASVTGCALSADGRIAVSTARDETIKVWNTKTGHCLTTLFVNEPLVDCACSADATSIVAVGNSGVYFLRLEL